MKQESKYLILWSLIICLFMTGCATKQTSPIYSTWNFSSEDEIFKPNKPLPNREILLFSALFGNVSGFVGNAVTIPVHFTDIELEPDDLKKTIRSALEPQQKINAKSIALASLATTEPNKTSWKIAESNEGIITTEWQPVKGRKAGMFWWEKTYLSEVRHIITISRAYDLPDLSSFKIETEVRERPNQNYPWSSADKETTEQLSKIPQEEIKDILLMSIKVKLLEKSHKESEQK